LALYRGTIALKLICGDKFMHFQQAQKGPLLDEPLNGSEPVANETDAKPVLTDQEQEASRGVLESRIAAHSARRKLSSHRRRF
jgi:hypothetical protein